MRRFVPTVGLIFTKFHDFCLVWAVHNGVLQVLDTMRPYLMSDGGNVRVSDIDGGIVRLKLEGACGTCPSSTMTVSSVQTVEYTHDCWRRRRYGKPLTRNHASNEIDQWWG